MNTYGSWDGRALDWMFASRTHLAGKTKAALVDKRGLGYHFEDTEAMEQLLP